MKNLLIIVATVLFAYLLATGLLLLVGHQGGFFTVLLALGLFAAGLTAWLLRSESRRR